MSTLSEFYIIFYIGSRLIIAYFVNQGLKALARERKKQGFNQLIHAGDLVGPVAALIPVVGESMLCIISVVELLDAFMKFVNNIYAKYSTEE